MLETINKNFDSLVETRRSIPRWLLALVVLAYFLPIFKELISYDKLEWLWFIYMIPALVLAYYHGLRGAAINIALSGSLIVFIESYYYFTLKEHTDIYNIFSVSFGAIFCMTIASFVVAVISTKLQIARKAMALTLETTTTAVGIVDKEGRVIYINKALEELSGTSRASVVGKHHWEVHSHLRKQNSEGGYQSILIKTLETEETYSNYEIKGDFGGSKKVLLIDTFLLRNDMDEVVGAMSNIRDITEKREMEQRVQQSEKFNVLGQMAAGLAHEIRNPLTSVRGFLQLFEAQEKEEKRKEHYGLILGELDRVNKLLTEFLLLAKPLAPRQEKTSLIKLLEDITSFMSCEAILHNVEIKTKLQKGLFPLFIDREQIKQVIINIIQNAIEATKEKGGIIEISSVMSFNQEEVLVEIRDNGIGIEPDSLNKIYDPFYTTKEEGTGLGLAVSYRIIENHNGWLKVSSQKGLGTKVTIGLPIVNLRRAMEA